MDIIACDIDNTVADQLGSFISHFDYTTGKVSTLYDNGDGKLVDLKIPEYKLILWAVWANNRLSRYFDFIFITARQQNFFNRTKTWLEKHGFIFKNLILTNNYDAKIPILKELSPFIYIDDAQKGQHELMPVICYDFLEKLDNAGINYELFKNNWSELEQKYMKIGESRNGLG